jgi:hypothetical protein
MPCNCVTSIRHEHVEDRVGILVVCPNCDTYLTTMFCDIDQWLDVKDMANSLLAVQWVLANVDHSYPEFTRTLENHMSHHVAEPTRGWGFL